MNCFQVLLSSSTCAATTRSGSTPTSRTTPGKAVHVDPIKPMLKPPETKRLKLKCDILLSTFAFNFNLRRYSEEPGRLLHHAHWQGLTLARISAQPEPFVSLTDRRQPAYPSKSAYVELKEWRSVRPWVAGLWRRRASPSRPPPPACSCGTAARPLEPAVLPT